MNRNAVRVTLDIEGIIQGVGFRPAVKRFADRRALGGWIQNRSECVRLVVEGERIDVESFIEELPKQLPPIARIDRTRRREEKTISGREYPGFTIRESKVGDGVSEMLPPDLAPCPQCLAEVTDPAQRRYGYPFTTCTDCGPRYTIAFGPPFDRARTTLAEFSMCPSCRKEYEDPNDRRFHAQTIACAECGPRLRLVDESGAEQPGPPLVQARAALALGAIVAVRGIGGYLLVVDAFDASAITRLRRRKNRPDKPLAVMAPDLSSAEAICDITAQEAAILQDGSAPIVVCRAHERHSLRRLLPLEQLSPDSSDLGIMLPTSPLHLLLAVPLLEDPTPRFDLLVMTSGNVSDRPICTDNQEALDALAGIADLWLQHDREIFRRCDDSLATIQQGERLILRRARGIAPRGVRLGRSSRRNILAMGAELKNTIAVTTENEVLLSPHIGDLQSADVVEALERAVPRLLDLAGRRPDAIAVDRHPDSQAASIGRDLASAWDIECLQVQHHHAHAAAVLAEHRRDSGLALVFDGTGFGEDGSSWGAEMLAIEPGKFTRLATFAAAPLPGGDAAIREPRRQLVARWQQAGIEPSPKLLTRLQIDPRHAAIWAQQCRCGVNAPLSHSAGRLFDSVAAALGLAPAHCSYEGQAAIRLEELARRCARDTAPPRHSYRALRNTGETLLRIDWAQVFESLVDVAWETRERQRHALAFHDALARAACEMAVYGREMTGERAIALGGGVFVNGLLVNILTSRLQREGFKVLRAVNLPPNDGAIAFGQVVVAAGRLQCA